MIQQKIYVSISSIFDKHDCLIKSLQSIAGQTLKPDVCFVNLCEHPHNFDKGFKDKKLPEKLKKYIDGNKLFSLRWVENTGAFCKLLPTLENKKNEDCVIITVDDDGEYHPKMVEKYLESYEKYNCVICSRCYNMNCATWDDMRYDNRNKIDDKCRHSIKNFHTGKGGVLFHPKFFKDSWKHLFDASIYQSCCPHNDDIWFNFHRIINKVSCFAPDMQTTVKDYTNKFAKYSLFYTRNSLNNYNDKQILQTIKTLRMLGYNI